MIINAVIRFFIKYFLRNGANYKHGLENSTLVKTTISFIDIPALLEYQ